MKALSTLIILAAAASASNRTFTVINKCAFTIWPAMFTDLNVGSAKPEYPTGWALDPEGSVSFLVPGNWQAGRIWGRRYCDFSNNGTGGPTSCLGGGCIGAEGGLICDPHVGTGAPPATLTQFTLGTNGNPDFYSVSLVDGYNLPVRISNDAGCPVADCPVNLAPNCPAPLKGPLDPFGNIGCKSACAAGLGRDSAGNNHDCCTGSYGTPATCPSSGVDYYSYFKTNCPNSAAYAFDTAQFTCNSNVAADYTITFCP